MAIPSVHVYAEGTLKGIVTDAHGTFTLNSDSPTLLVSFSALGFATQTLEFSGLSTEIIIRLVPTIIDMDPLVVSASRELQPRTDVPVAISAISAVQLENTRPELLYQVLNQVAGVHMVNLSNEQYKMSIRQPFSNKAYFLYMEDGVPLRPVGIFNPNALIDVNMAGVDRIEIVKGPSSDMFGGNAVAGAVNFITSTPSLRSGSFGLRRNNYGYTRADFAGSGIQGRTGLFIGGYVSRQRDGWYEHTDYDKVSLTARLDRELNASTTLEATMTYSNLDTDTNGALDSLSFSSRGFNSPHTFSYRQVESLRARTTLKKAWSKSQKSDVTLFMRANSLDQIPYWRVRTNRKDRSRATGETNLQEFWSLGTTAQHEIRFERMNARLSGGLILDYSPSTYLAEYIDVARVDGKYASFSSPDSLLSDYSADLFNGALYSRLELEPSEDLLVSGSLRFDRIRYDFDNQLGGEAYSGADDEIRSFQAISPKLGLTYDFGQGRGVYSNASISFAPPEINELYHGVSVPSLKPARFTSYEVGGWAALLEGRLFLDLAVYAMEGRDEIIPIVSPSGGFVNENAGHTRHRGIEYTVFAKPSNSVSLRASGSRAVHSFIDFVDFGVDQSGNDMAFAPKWTSNVELAFEPDFVENGRMSLEWTHLGTYYMDNSNLAEYEGYDVFNIRASYDLGELQFWANVDNVFDKLYATNAAAYSWGSIYNVGQVRAFSLGARYRLN